MCDNNGDTFIATLHKVILALDLCYRLSSIIVLIIWYILVYFIKGFTKMYFGAKEKNSVNSPQSAQRKHAFLGEIKEMSKTKKLPSRKKIALELLHHRLGQISTRSFLYGYTANFWGDIELRINSDTFFRLCHISSMKTILGLKPTKSNITLHMVFNGHNNININKMFEKWHNIF